MSDHHRFECQSCGACVVVDESIRRDILRNGCPICLAPASEDVLEPVDSSETASPN